MRKFRKQTKRQVAEGLARRERHLAEAIAYMTQDQADGNFSYLLEGLPSPHIIIKHLEQIRRETVDRLADLAKR